MNRRKVLIAIVLTIGWSAAAAFGVSWTQHQGDAAHTGYVGVNVDPARIQQIWSVTTSQLGQSAFVPGAVTDSSRTYVTGRTSDGLYHVHALNLATGARQWVQSFAPYSYPGLSQPCVGNNKVYVHQWGHSGISGGNPAQYPYLMGMDAQTGAKQFATSHAGQWSSGGRPTVAGDQVFCAGGYYGGLDAYNAITGERVWSIGVAQTYGWIPAADQNLVYTYLNSTLQAYRRTDGGLAFSISNGSNGLSSTVTLGQDGEAIVCTSGNLTSFDLQTRSRRWSVSGNFNGSFAVADGIVFASNGIELDLYDALTGAKIGYWFAPPGRYMNNNLLVTRNLIFAQTDQATYALDRLTLQPVWSAAVTGTMSLGDGLLLVNNNNAITAFDLPEPSSLILLALVGLALVRCRYTAPGR